MEAEFLERERGFLIFKIKQSLSSSLMLNMIFNIKFINAKGEKSTIHSQCVQHVYYM